MKGENMYLWTLSYSTFDALTNRSKNVKTAYELNLKKTADVSMIKK